MANIADIVLYSKTGKPTVMVEAKTVRRKDRVWAAKLARNMLAYAQLPEVDFFVLATPEWIYFWNVKRLSADAEVEPDLALDARVLLKSYFDQSNLDPKDISGEAFELVVGSWLSDVANSSNEVKRLGEETPWLSESSFLEAVRDGRLEYEVAA